MNRGIPAALAFHLVAPLPILITLEAYISDRLEGWAEVAVVLSVLSLVWGVPLSLVLLDRSMHSNRNIDRVLNWHFLLVFLLMMTVMSAGIAFRVWAAAWH